jgi:hypothetical protein
MARAVAANPDNANYFAISGCNPDGTRDPALPVLLDVDNLIDYMLVIFYTGDGDATLSSFLNNERPNNWFGLRNRNNPDRGFIFFNHDAEHTLGAPHSQFDRTGPFPSPNQNTFSYANPQWIHEDLMNNAEYRLRFADHVQRHFFNGAALTPETATSRFLRKAAQIDKAVRAYSARWGDAQREPPYGETDWRSMINSIVQEWFPPRTDLVLQQLKMDGLYPSLSAPLVRQLQVSLPTASALTLTHTNASGTIFYTTDGSDPRVAGGGLQAGARVYSDPLPVVNITRVLARVREAPADSGVVGQSLPFGEGDEYELKRGDEWNFKTHEDFLYDNLTRLGRVFANGVVNSTTNEVTVTYVDRKIDPAKVKWFALERMQLSDALLAPAQTVATGVKLTIDRCHAGQWRQAQEANLAVFLRETTLNHEQLPLPTASGRFLSGLKILSIDEAAGTLIVNGPGLPPINSPVFQWVRSSSLHASGPHLATDP